MYNTQELAEQYQKMYKKAELIRENAINMREQTARGLRQGAENCAKLYALFDQELNNEAKVIRIEEQKRRARVREQEAVQQWADKRAKHMKIQQERNMHLLKTLELLKRCQSHNQRIKSERQLQQQEIVKITGVMKQAQKELKAGEESKSSRKVELTNLKNLPLRKGIDADWKNGLIKVTVERSSKEDISAGGLAQFMLKYEQHRYLPAGEYPQPIVQAIKQFNFHKDIHKLKSDLAQVSTL